MNTINEVEKQLAKKADAYLERKAKEMIDIRKEIEQMLDITPSHVDYITNYNAYCGAIDEDRLNYVGRYTPCITQDKLIDELTENYKVKLVQKYTIDLLSKLDSL